MQIRTACEHRQSLVCRVADYVRAVRNRVAIKKRKIRAVRVVYYEQSIVLVADVCDLLYVF